MERVGLSAHVTLGDLYFGFPRSLISSTWDSGRATHGDAESFGGWISWLAGVTLPLQDPIYNDTATRLVQNGDAKSSRFHF